MSPKLLSQRIRTGLLDFKLHWYTGTQSFQRWVKTLGTYIEICIRLIVSKLFNQQFKSTKGIIWYIIIWDGEKFISLCFSLKGG